MAQNVVDLTAFRRLRAAVASPSTTDRISVFYLNGGGSCDVALRSFPVLDVVSIHCPKELDAISAEKKPALILVEAFLGWADPVVLIERFVSQTACTALMVYRPEDKAKNTKLFKRAFQVGLFDTVTAPLTREDLRERLHIVFKLNPHFA